MTTGVRIRLNWCQATRSCVFPAAEANHPDYESDTWFLAGELTAGSRSSVRLLTIFNKNRPGQSIVADFYTFALFDLGQRRLRDIHGLRHATAEHEAGARPKLSVENGHLDLSYDSRAGQAVWRTCRDEQGRLMPYTYDVTLIGTDAARRRHVAGPARDALACARPARRRGIQRQDRVLRPGRHVLLLPNPHGDDRHTAVGSDQEKVTGATGHVDRQWFPLVANNGGPTGDIRSRAHEWRTINLDNGVDLSIWRQFDRIDHNALQPFSGATTSSPDAEPEYADDIEITVESYVRWPEPVRTLVPPPAAARYMPDRHRLTSHELELDLDGEPLVPAPAHALPLEYMEGPYRYRGTFRGEPVSGFAFYERSLALYRDWELADVLAAAGPAERDLVLEDIAKIRS